MLTKDVISKPPSGGTVGNVQLKRTTPNLLGSPLSSSEVDVHAEQFNSLPSKRNSGSPPNPTTRPGNQRQLPPKPGTTQPCPRKLPRSTSPTDVVDKLTDNPSNGSRLVPNSPMPSNQRPPPKPRTPPISSGKDGARNKRILSKRNLLNRNTHLPSTPSTPSTHISPIKLNPIPSIPMISRKLLK
jgi:hypothetical protein